LAYSVLGAGLVLVAALWIHRQWHGFAATRLVSDGATTLAALLATALCLRRARALADERRLAWVLLGLACLAWGLGNVAWTYQELWLQRGTPAAQRDAPFPSVADAGYAAFVPLAAGALLVFVIGATPAASRLRTALDGLLVTSALLFAAWVLVLRRILDGTGSAGALARTLAIGYPAADAFLLGLLLLVASRSTPTVRRTMAHLGAAFLAFLVADAGFWYSVAAADHPASPWTEPGWLAGFLLIGYAALRPIPASGPREAPSPGLWLSALPLAPFVASTALAVAVQVREGALPPFLFWNALAVVCVLATRQFVMLYETVRLRRESEEALRRLREAERVRSDLLHAISHDIQNPLTPIQLQLRILRDRGALPGPDRERLAVVQRNVDQVARLTADLADVSKLQDGRLPLLRQPMDLQAVLRDVVESFLPLAAERGIALRAGGDAPLPLEGDPMRLRQVVANLVSNALKFTPAGGSVTAAGRAEPGRVVVEVADTGRGLAPEEAARLFRPFAQVHPPGEGRERGTGLGLYISRGLVEAHGGGLGVESAGRGKGATFRLWLPTAAAPQPAAARVTEGSSAASPLAPG
jgi:signal transduction histidine kinase